MLPHILLPDLGSLKEFCTSTGVKFSPTSKDAHKNSRGRALLLGGSLSAGGALLLTAKACLHGGLGYATVLEAKPERLNLDSLGEWCVRPLSLENWNEHLRSDQVVIFGPGLKAECYQDRREFEFFEPYLELLAENSGNLNGIVVDGGGLPLFLKCARDRSLKFSCPLLLTPHVGEAERLLVVCGEQAATLREEIWAQLLNALRSNLPGAGILLKGSSPLFSTLRKDSVSYQISFADPALATAGSGDVLSGFLAALLFRLRESRNPTEAALGVGLFVQALSLEHCHEGILASELSQVFSRTLAGIVDEL